ncbi:MAG: penicillin-binding protein activator LpoB [Deltaproteobacteria bacterium]|nr:MAG: penicillin-binding protein activator LpoB [Deltaproteobacteria bacterium]
MGKITRIGVLILLAGVLLPGIAWAKPRVAVMNFDNKTQYGGWRLGYGAADILTTEMVKTGKFKMMERENLQTVLNEQNLGHSGRIDPGTAARIGKIIGVEYIITGAVTEYGQSRVSGGGGGVSVGKKGYHATVDIRIVDAETSEIVFADSASHSQSTLSVRVFGFGGGEGFNEKRATAVMRKAIQKLAAKIAETPLKSGVARANPAMAAQVLVADVDGNVVTLNKGQSAGYSIDQEIGIYRVGKVIKDPASGRILKKKYKKVGMIRLTAVEDGYSEGKIISGSGFKVGDMVR